MFFIGYKKKLEEADSQISNLKSIIRRMTEKELERTQEAHICSPLECLNHIIQNGVEWYDYTTLDKANLEEYKQLADALVKNPVLKNEINFLINNYAKKSLVESKSFKDVRDMRMQSIALRALLDRLNSIPKPTVERAPLKDPHSAI